MIWVSVYPSLMGTVLTHVNMLTRTCSHTYNTPFLSSYNKLSLKTACNYPFNRLFNSGNFQIPKRPNWLKLTILLTQLKWKTVANSAVGSKWNMELLIATPKVIAQKLNHLALVLILGYRHFNYLCIRKPREMW